MNIDQPEHRLIIAVLDQAKKDLKSSKEKASATRWVMSDDQRPFGFEWCCYQLGLEPSWLRGRMNCESL